MWRDRREISLREHKTFTIPIRAKKQFFKTTKQSVIHSIFSTQKITKIIYSNKLVRLQRTIKAFLRRKGFYTKVFLSSIRGKIRYSVQSYIFNILYYYIPSRENSINSIEDDFLISEERQICDVSESIYV